MSMNSQIDISGILPAVRVPTLVIHRTGTRLSVSRADATWRRIFPARAFLSFPELTTFSTSARTQTKSPMRSRSF